MPKRKKKDEWLNEVPAHLRPHLQQPRRIGRPRKPIGDLKPRPVRNASEARKWAAAVEQRIELMKKEQEWDVNALAQIPVQVEMVVEDPMGGDPQPVEWVDEEPERCEVVDEGDGDEEETAGEVTGEVTGEVATPYPGPDRDSEEWLKRSHEERIDAIDEEEACQVMLDSHSYYEAAERLRLTLGELKALRRRKKFNELYTQRYEAAKKAMPRPYAIKPYQYWEERGDGPLQLRMDEIILTLIQYPTVAQAARKLGIKPSTLDVLRRDPRFQVRFHERRQEALALGTLILQMNYSKINQELLAMAFDPDVPAVVRANISLQLSKRVEDQIEKEQNNERMVKQLEEYKAVIERAGKGNVEEVTVEGEEK